jgi:hypothetical protein
MINDAQERINSDRAYASQRPPNLGQSLPTVVTATMDDSEMNSIMPMSANEKRVGVRRAEKLERMFGARPPQDLVINANSPSMSRNSTSADSGVVQPDTTTTVPPVFLPLPAIQQPSLLDLLDMDDNEQLPLSMNSSYHYHNNNNSQNNSQNSNLAPLSLDGASLISLLLEDDSTVDSLLEYVSLAEPNHEDPNTPEAIYDRGIRQRRLRKLRRFFGYEIEADQLSP